MSQLITRFLRIKPILNLRGNSHLPACFVRSSSMKAQSEDTPELTVQDVISKLRGLMGVRKGYETLQKPRHHLLQFLPSRQEDLPVRKMTDSFASAIVPLSSDVILQNKYVSHLGHVRLGRLLEDMDIFAVWCAMKHISIEKQPPDTPTPFVIVTVLVDEISFTDYTPTPNSNIRLSGHVCWVGRSSIEVVVWLEQEQHGVWQKITRALFLMAARNATNTGAALVNRLEATNDEEAKILQGGEDRKMRRQKSMSKSLLKTTPDEFEQRLIHDIFIKTVDPLDLTLLRRVLPPNSTWMENAQQSNVIYSQPEDRNLHNKVFGGFLMRHALELAWVTGYLHGKHRPRLLHISDIAFHKPVNVGSILHMYSYVSYTEEQFMQIVVHCEVSDPSSGGSRTTNMFHFTFSSVDRVLSVVPKTYHEAMLYVDGRRHFHEVMGLKV